MGLGMGLAMAGRMMQDIQQASPGSAATAPPPLPGTAWHIAVGGQTQGPFSAAQITDGIARGQVTAQTLVWMAGMSGWLPAGEVPQLAGLFAAASPPPPPAPKG